MKLSILNIFTNPRHAVSCSALLVALLLMRFARWLLLRRLDAPATGKDSSSHSWNSAAASANRSSNAANRVRLDVAFFEEPEREIMIADQLARHDRVRSSFPAACIRQTAY